MKGKKERLLDPAVEIEIQVYSLERPRFEVRPRECMTSPVYSPRIGYGIEVLVTAKKGKRMLSASSSDPHVVWRKCTAGRRALFNAQPAPQAIAKLFEVKERVGAGDGNRTHV